MEIKMKMKYLIILLCTITYLNAEYYKVNVKRESKDLYKVYPNIMIQTKYCYEYTYGDEAILKYSENAYDNELTFSSGTKCNVSSVIEISNNKVQQSNPNQYFIEAAANDETFIINGEVFKAKTYCLGWSKGDSIIFIEGSALGVCTSAKLFNSNRNQTCDVWCE